MKKIITILALGVLVSVSVNAQKKADKASSGTSISIGAEVGFPTGGYGTLYNLGIGGSAKIAFPIMESADLTVSAGYSSFSVKSSVGSGSLGLFAGKAGFRYRFDGGLYVEPQLGYGSVTGGSGLVFAGGVGYLVNNQWDFSARYESLSLTGGSFSQFGVRAAYSFSLGK